jgi:hypothetical protein
MSCPCAFLGVLLPPQLASRLTSNTANRPLDKLSFIRVAFIENHLFRRRHSFIGHNDSMGVALFLKMAEGLSGLPGLTDHQPAIHKRSKAFT